MNIVAYPALIAAAALLAVAPAAAQDATGFTGPRVEATVGLSQLRFDLSEIGGSTRAHTSDLGYGGAVGYDTLLAPNLIGGIELGASGADASYRRGGATNGGSLRERRELFAAGRIGTAITPNTLLYGLAGYSNLQVRETRTVASVTNDTLRDLDGLLLGAGVEVKISPKAYVKSEYRYGNYADGYTTNQVKTGVGLRF